MPYDMISFKNGVRVGLLSGLTLTACGDDVVDTNNGSTGDAGSSETTDGPAGTTTDDTTTTTDDSTTTSAGATTSSTSDSTTRADSSSGGESSTTMVDPTEGGSSSSSSSGGEESSSSSSSSTGGMMMMECPYGELMAPDLVNLDTTGQDSEFTNSCGGGGAPDVSYTLTAPADGTYFFTATSPDGVVDPLVAVYDGECGGPELACNEDIDGTTSAARVSAALTAGDTVTVVVDGFSVAGGAVDLEVAFFEGTCPDGTLGDPLPILQSGSTVDGDNTVFGSCGGTTANDDQWSFTAPQSGVYTVDTLGSNFDTVLYVLDGCGGTELVCNDDGGIDQTSRVNVTLTMGDEVIFVVDGAGLDSGDYDLNVAFDECPDFALGTDFPVQVTGNTDFETDASQGSCGPGDSNDVAYTFTAPEAGTYVFDTNGSDFDTVLYYYLGETCAGVEQECDDDGGIGLDSQLVLDLAADETITVIVDGRNGGSGDYVLNVTAPECGNGNIEVGEECDGAVIPDTCFSLGLGGGALACDPVTCQYDTSACGDDCGNGTVDAGEACDLGEIGGATCMDSGFAGGSIGCGADCQIDTSECSDDLVVVCSTPAAAISNALGTTTDTVNVATAGTIADVDVFVDITHSWVGDVDIELSGDDLGLSAMVADGECGSQNDIFAFFNDEGDFAAGTACIEPITLEGNMIPVESLSVFDGSESAGDWSLNITDNVGGDDGTLNEWCIFLDLQ